MLKQEFNKVLADDAKELCQASRIFAQILLAKIIAIIHQYL
jgi:hypothetical protein